MAHQPIHLYNEIARFEDVDAAAIVYHPVYLNYLERARSQSLIDKGHSFKRVLDEGLGLVIASIDMKYVRPIALEDRFIVGSQVDDYTKSCIVMTQVIATDVQDFSRTHLKSQLREMQTLRFFAHLKLFVVSQKTMRPAPTPDWLITLLTHE